MKYAKRNGLLPDAETQVLIGAAQIYIAHRVARRQGRQGVDPPMAAHHAFRAAMLVPFYVVFILPVMAMSMLVMTSNPVFHVWRAAQIGLGLLIGVRMLRWLREPATNRLVYSVPTWVLVVAGGISVAVFSGFIFYKMFVP